MKRSHIVIVKIAWSEKYLWGWKYTYITNCTFTASDLTIQSTQLARIIINSSLCKYRTSRNNAVLLICGRFVGSEVTCWQPGTRYSLFPQACMLVQSWYHRNILSFIYVKILHCFFAVCEHMIRDVRIMWHVQQKKRKKGKCRNEDRKERER